MNTIFIHGYGGQPGLWDCLRAVLPKGLRGTAIPLPGHGQRSLDEAPFTIERAASEIVRALPREGSLLIGHSMGSRIAMTVAAHARGGVCGLVLVDGSCVPADPARAARFVRDALATRGLRGFAEETVRDEITHRLTDSQRDSLIASHCNVSAQALIDYMADMANWDSSEFKWYLLLISCPVLVLQSTRFPVENPPCREEVGDDPSSEWFNSWAKIGNASVEVIKSSGHYPMIDQTKIVAEKIARFSQTP